MEKSSNHMTESPQTIQMVLAGQPNCGKSTIFNEVAGYKSVISNFPGATVSYTKSHIHLNHQHFNLIDLPGIYSLSSSDDASREAQHYLLQKPIDMIINVVDASILSRSLELTLQLLDLRIPIVLCLNMMDDAERKGIDIDIDKLESILGIPVVPTIATHGKGVQTLFRKAIRAAYEKKIGNHIKGNRDVEKVIAGLVRYLQHHDTKKNIASYHLWAKKLLECDPYFEKLVIQDQPDQMEQIQKCRRDLFRSHGHSSDQVINAERHALSMTIFEKVTLLHKPHIDWKERVDDILMHPFWGYVGLFTILFLYFYGVFSLGKMIETPLLSFLESKAQLIYGLISNQTLLTVLQGVLGGLVGGIAIVLPYLLPFLIVLAFLENIGYLPRVAFLMDSLMHKVGLHGTAIIPCVLGYGCNVPAVMATRILESSRDRFIASFLSTMIPCSARMTIIFGLVGYYMGGIAALGIYLLNLFIVAVSGALLSRLLPEATPGMVLEIPRYQLPGLKSILNKTWWRIKEFIVIAWPLLIAGSLVLTLTDALNWTPFLNTLVRPFTWLLGLPPEVGTTLIFGILRKELSMLMLKQALGMDLHMALTYGQMLVFTVFVVFYVPCVATVGALIKQIRYKGSVLVVLYTVVLALFLGLVVRGVTVLMF